MKKGICLLAILLLAAGCQRNSTETWEDVKTAANHMKKGIYSLWGNNTDSKQILSANDFVGPDDNEFIPLRDDDLNTHYAATDTAIEQPKELQESKSGITKFFPSKDTLFSPIHFATDDHVIRDRINLVAIDKIAAHMKKNPNLYLKVDGHCDKRASAAYNMALGMRRANHVRVLLIKKGIDFNRIYTTSFGKEKPIAIGNTPEDYKMNRRSEFKIFTNPR